MDTLLRERGFRDARGGDTDAAGLAASGQTPGLHPARTCRTVSAVGLGLGSYKSAWLLCAKLRRAMVAPERNPLTGLVEADETSVSYRTKDGPPAGGPGVATPASCWSRAPSRSPETVPVAPGCG